MLLKNEVLGVRCKLAESQQGIYDDEVSVFFNNKNIVVKKKHLGFLEPRERFAVIGASQCYLSNKAIISLLGPTKTRYFLVKINSRGYLHEILVPEEDVLFLR